MAYDATIPVIIELLGRVRGQREDDGDCLRDAGVMSRRGDSFAEARLVHKHTFYRIWGRDLHQESSQYLKGYFLGS